MNAQEIFENLKAEFNDAIIELVDEAPSDPFIKIAADKVFDVCHHLRDTEGMMFDYLASISGMDLGEKLGVVYHLFSYELKQRIVIKAEVDKDKPDIATVERVWRAADWHERETYDLFGVNFVGHHNMIRILNPYDWEGHPLRKDYETPEEYHGISISN